ncbi:hypothetical protein QFZ81_005769 [Paenibacillus sp. V4I9]|uniref:hypothetical protein n=1 Tax=Paenibacillus sp. V4I9 TaxID=3042308 RepID=UPI002787CF6E|nr:hypothetical protein [Paenibacillus sp. V4I9]MDQ0890681.1 hypothetical protein [Paenibacillus sp. V4I9]
MDTKDKLISHYVKSVKEKDQLLKKLSMNTLPEKDLHKLLLLNCELNELVGKMIEAGLIQIEITE